ncbi:MAG: hypothetical protein PHC48_02685 [Prevotella sp.]|nr:hypothetical protein [Prevotella sp.]
MSDIEITIQTILAFFGGITCVVAGVSAITKLFNPFKDLKKRIDEHEKKLSNDNLRMNNMENTMCEVEESNKVICKSLLVLLNHEITGNCVDKLKLQRDVLEQFLVDK